MTKMDQLRRTPSPQNFIELRKQQLEHIIGLA